MSAVVDKAMELGELVLETAQAKKLNEAREAYNNDTEAKSRMDEFAAYKNTIQQGRDQNTLSDTEFKSAQNKLSDMSLELQAIPSIGNLISAENEFNLLVNQVFNVLRATITGQGSGCSPSDCSSCGGGCH